MMKFHPVTELQRCVGVNPVKSLRPLLIQSLYVGERCIVQWVGYNDSSGYFLVSFYPA